MAPNCIKISPPLNWVTFHLNLLMASNSKQENKIPYRFYPKKLFMKIVSFCNEFVIMISFYGKQYVPMKTNTITNLQIII